MNASIPTIAQRRSHTSISILFAGSMLHNSLHPPITPASDEIKYLLAKYSIISHTENYIQELIDELNRKLNANTTKIKSRVCFHQCFVDSFWFLYV